MYVLGSLYLAYDLLGGQHGPLRLLTRAVTYSIIYGIDFRAGVRPHDRLELNRAARGREHYGKKILD